MQGARERLFGSWEMNWMAFNVAQDMALPGSEGPEIPSSCTRRRKLRKDDWTALIQRSSLRDHLDPCSVTGFTRPARVTLLSFPGRRPATFVRQAPHTTANQARRESNGANFLRIRDRATITRPERDGHTEETRTAANLISELSANRNQRVPT